MHGERGPGSTGARGRSPSRPSTPLLLAPLIVLLLLLLPGRVAQAQTPSYSRDVRPILADKCFSCHGPDEATRAMDLRLDLPGHDLGEELLLRIVEQDPTDRMPPVESGKVLSPAEIQVLRRWVEAGSPYERHWAFVAPKRPPLPEAPGLEHAIDRFVSQRLQEAGLSLSPEADRTTLLRRVHLDLIGLPPTPEQTDAFLADERPDAYERLVDSLLASPHYGERWARRWLDLARYSDTNGYEKDRNRSIWPYRDWVIRALNEDIGFAAFTEKQIAGDMLPGATPDDLIATGFHRNTMLNEEGGIDPLEYRYISVADRVATTGAAFLGLTLGCAQCHTHKFDPITHREYFGLFAYLNNADEPDYLIPDPQAEKRRLANQRKGRALLDELWNAWPEDAGERDTRHAEWLSARRDEVTTWSPVVPSSATANEPTLAVHADGTVMASGDTTKHDTYRLQIPATDRIITAIRLEALPHETLPGGGPGLTYYEGIKGDFFLTVLEVTAGPEDSAQPVAMARATESFTKNQYGNHRTSATLATDGDLRTGWSIARRTGERHVATFIPAEPIPAGSPLTIEMHFGRHFASSLGRFRFSVTDREGGAEAMALPLDDDGSIEASLLKPDEDLDSEERLRLRDAFLLATPEVRKQTDRVRALRRRQEHTTTLVMRERAAEARRPTHRHHRGEWLQVREEVTPHLPEALGVAAPPKDRLGFARWLVSRNNPLTARVVVNRHWSAFFGRGIVDTVADFGAQGAVPSHPALLDWLAVTFMEGGWSLKRLHRLIVTSATYRQSSAVTPEALERDPTNRWLARAPRLRLDAEVLRDSYLVAAGKLSRKAFGPPVRPPQPVGVTEVAYGNRKWHASKGEDRFRRSLYTFQKRTAPFAFHVTFDAPSGESCVEMRDRSSTPLQALTLLNDPMMLELAAALGLELATHAQEHGREQTLRHAFRRVLTRTPDEEELATLARFLAQQPEGTSAADAWTAVARALFCLDEAITRN